MALGTLIAWLRLVGASKDQGARISAAVNIAYGFVVALSSLSIVPPKVPDWWAWAVTPIGVMILVIAQGLGMWASRTLDKSFSPRLEPAEGARLNKSGPYQICRHPIMLSMLMSWIGTAIALGSWVMLVCFGFVSILIMRRVSLEETALKERFGEEFEQYRREVSMIVPFLDPKSQEAQEIENAVSRLRDSGCCKALGRCG